MDQPLTEKRGSVLALLKEYPNLSDRAIARMVGVSPHTVGFVRKRWLPATTQRYEADGRKARGPHPVSGEWDKVPDNMTAVYRCYGKISRRGKMLLLYVGCSYNAFLQLSTHKTHPWFKDITTIKISHYRTKRAAQIAEEEIILRDNPMYRSNFNLTDEKIRRNIRYAAQREIERRYAKAQITRKALADRDTVAQQARQIETVPEVMRQAALQRHAEMYQQAEARSGRPARLRPGAKSVSQPAETP